MHTWFTSQDATNSQGSDQKVMDLQFNPLGSAQPQLVVACDRAPCELALIDLERDGAGYCGRRCAQA